MTVTSTVQAKPNPGGLLGGGLVRPGSPAEQSLRGHEQIARQRPSFGGLKPRLLSLVDLSRTLLLTATLAASLGLTTGCGRQSEQQAATRVTSPAALTNVILAESSLAVPSAVTFIAREKGFWRDKGLEVQAVPFAAGRLAFDAVLAGKADLATVAETPLVLAAFRNQDFKILCTIMKSDKEMKVIARKNAGVSKPADLKGKKVATLVGSNADFFMEAFLASQGIKRSEVEVVNLNPPDMVTALLNGDIAAAFTWQPHIWNAQKRLGNQALIFPNNGIYKEGFHVVTSGAFAEKHPELIEKVLRGLVEAAEFARSHRDEAIAIVADQVKVPAEGIREFWSDFDFTAELSREVINSMKAQGAWAMEAKVAPAGAPLPDFSKHVLAGPMSRLYPDRVHGD